jgi:hypothetical protein
MRLNISHAGVSELVIQTAGEGATKRLAEIVEEVKRISLDQFRQSEEFQQMLQSDDPIEQTKGSYQQSVAGI